MLARQAPGCVGTLWTCRRAQTRGPSEVARTLHWTTPRSGSSPGCNPMCPSCNLTLSGPEQVREWLACTRGQHRRRPSFLSGTGERLGLSVRGVCAASGGARRGEGSGAGSAGAGGGGDGGEWRVLLRWGNGMTRHCAYCISGDEDSVHCSLHKRVKPYGGCPGGVTCFLSTVSR